MNMSRKSSIGDILMLLLGISTIVGGQKTFLGIARSSKTANREAAVFSLYEIPTFRVYIEIPKVATSVSLIPVGRDMKEVTEKYLMDFMQSSSKTEEMTLHSVDLQVSLKSSKLPQKGLRNPALVQVEITLSGEAAFYDRDEDETDHQELVNSLVKESFNDYNLVMYKMRITSSDNSALENADRINVDSNPVVEGGFRDPMQGFNAPQQRGSSDKITRSDALMVFVMGLFMSLCILSIYLFLSRDYRRYRKDRRYIASFPLFGIDDDDDLPGEGNNPNGQQGVSTRGRPGFDVAIQSSSDPNYNGSGGSKNIVPVPASRGGAAAGPVPRRYVKPSSPLDLLFGASFTHQELSRVSENRTSRRKKSRRKSSGTIRPMLSIAEEESSLEDEFDSGHGFVATTQQLLRQLTSCFDNNKPNAVLANEVPTNDAPSGMNELPFVYRDFPRHDGTPCLMYTNDKKPPPKAFTHNATGQESTGDDPNMTADGPLVPVGSFASSEASVEEEAADTFLDKLERLMILRKKKYEEKSKLDQEMKRKKRERFLRRQQEKVEKQEARKEAKESESAPPKQEPLATVQPVVAEGDLLSLNTTPESKAAPSPDGADLISIANSTNPTEKKLVVETDEKQEAVVAPQNPFDVFPVTPSNEKLVDQPRVSTPTEVVGGDEAKNNDATNKDVIQPPNGSPTGVTDLRLEGL